MKNYSKIVYGLIAVSLVNLIVGLFMTAGLPESIPVHFNIRFEVDRMGSKWFMAVFMALPLLVSLGIAMEQKLRGKGYANNKQLSIFAVLFVALFIALGWTFYAMCGTGAQMGDVTEVPLDLVLGLGLSLLFVVMGNYLPTVKPNRTLGIRLRATLKNEEVWKKTHRFSGPIMMVGGLILAVSTLIGYFTGLKWFMSVGVLGVLGSLIVQIIYVKRIEKRLKG